MGVPVEGDGRAMDPERLIARRFAGFRVANSYYIVTHWRRGVLASSFQRQERFFWKQI